MKVPYIDLQQQYRNIKSEIIPEINKVLDSSAYILGPAVADFEQQYAEFCTSRHAIGVNSGTSALHLALLALGIGPGDEVIAPAMTFLATTAAIDYTGARPVCVDIDPVSYCIAPDKIEAAITPATKAIVAVHLYGHPADMDKIMDIASRHGLYVVEDAAQAHGAEYKGTPCGSIGHIAGFSFYPGKNLGAYGEGGAVTTNDDALAEKVRMLRDWGAKEKYQHVLRGFNYRMDGIQGAVLGVKMKYIRQWNELRRQAADLYKQALENIEGISLPTEMDYAKHVYHVYALQTDHRDTLAEGLKKAGIASGIHYPTPIHLQECYSDWGYKAGDFSIAEQLAKQEFSLPIFPEITPEQIEFTVETIKTTLRNLLDK